MSADQPPSPKVYGWCPGALRPMQSGDGLVLRIRAPLGRLTQDQALGIARLSARFGNGQLDLTARANLQIRGLDARDHPTVIEALRALDLVDHNAEAEARRNFLITPFWHPGEDDPALASGLAPGLAPGLALALEKTLAEAKDLKLPGKFGFAIDTGPLPVLQDSPADIRIERQANGALMVRADGAHVGKEVQPEDAAQSAVELARWFLAQGGAPEGRGRMHRLIARRGAPTSHGAPFIGGAETPAPGPQVSGHLVALEFGQIPASTLAKLAERAAIRLTPWRMLLLETSQPPQQLPGLILDATDPRLRVFACTGHPGCLQAHAKTRSLARALAPSLKPGQMLHVSGCSKGCAHPAAADRTVVATAPDTFDLIAHGKASDPPLQTALTAGALRAMPELLNKGQP